MTSVINLNILNFFRLNQDNSTVNNVRFKTVTLDRHANEGPGQERVIDVTPFSRVITDNEGSETNSSSQHAVRHKALSRQRNGPGTTYTRQGRVLQYHDAKGTYVDLYV